jgi:hypothetical protein
MLFRIYDGYRASGIGLYRKRGDHLIEVGPLEQQHALSNAAESYPARLLPPAQGPAGNPAVPTRFVRPQIIRGIQVFGRGGVFSHFITLHLPFGELFRQEPSSQTENKRQ